MPRSIFIDMTDLSPGPKRGDRVASVGVNGNINSVYLVLESYKVKRRDPQAVPRYSMKVEKIEGETRKRRSGRGWSWFEFRWYSRKPRKSQQTFEQFMKRSVDID